MRWPKTKYGKIWKQILFRSIIKKMCKIYEETQILLSQKYGKGDRKFAEIQGTDLTLGAVGSDKILKENPI